jgi:hypothetical protein
MFDLSFFQAFADDSYEPREDLSILIVDLQRSLEAITKWFFQSGLKVNESKADLFHFHKHDHAFIQVYIDGTIIKSKSVINVLDVLFDSKL